MKLLTPSRRALAAAPLLTLGLAACGTSSVSTGSFQGEARNAAQTIANLQTDAQGGEESKICANDLSASAVAQLGGKKGCESAVKEQLAQISNFEASVSAVTVAPGGRTATATVKSVWDGKSKVHTVSLVHEGGHWRIASLA